MYREVTMIEIREVLQHADLSTTQGYMHLSPAATEDAIRLLDGRDCGGPDVEAFGDISDTKMVQESR